jgi:hypothetical protein
MRHNNKCRKDNPMIVSRSEVFFCSSEGIGYAPRGMALGQGGVAAFNAAVGFNWTANVTYRRAERGTRKATPPPHGAPIIDERPHRRRRLKRRPDSFLRGTGPPP